jgi:hypothetical protein
LIDEAVFRRERNLDMYHAVESLCFYNTKEISNQMVELGIFHSVGTFHHVIYCASKHI